MVAIVIAGLTISGLYTLFNVQSRQFVVQDLHMEMHQNMRFATDMITRSVRMAGYGSNGSVNGVLGPNGSTDENDELPVIISHDDPDGDDGPDAITVVYADPSLMMDSQNNVIEACGTTSLTFRPGHLSQADKISQFTAGELMMCFDYADMRGMNTFIWALSADGDSTNGVIYVDDNSTLSDYAAACPSNENLTPILTCSKANVFTFYIDDDSTTTEQSNGPGTAENPVLMLDLDMSWPDDDDIPLVDNIEDLQIEYCVNDDPTTTVDCSDSSVWTDSVADGDNAYVWMVRISMVVRSARADPRDLYPGSRPALGNRSAGSGGDNYYRQVISSEVTVRNLRYQSYL